MTALERELHLPEQLSSVTRARHFVRDVLLGCRLEGLVDDAQLGTSELVANAVRHAGTGLVLRIRVDGAVRIAIEDGRPELRRPLLRETDELAEGGRGLQIVAAIAQDWGITASAAGKVVWFSLPLPEQAGDDATVLPMARRRPAAFDPAYDHSPRAEENVEARREGMAESRG